jgi:hypothetical protein
MGEQLGANGAAEALALAVDLRMHAILGFQFGSGGGKL